jgi:hypothetical protein
MSPTGLTHRQRILAALNHQMPDRLPWAPYFRTWWDAHRQASEVPDFLAGAGDYLQAFAPLGLSILDKGAPAIRPVFEGVEIRQEDLPGGLQQITFVTPVGEVSSISQPTSAYDHTTYKVSYEFKSFADYPVIYSLYESLRFEPNYGDYLSKQASIGEAGQYMSEGPDTPLHQLFVYWAGYEVGSYLLYDYPKEMDRLLGLMLEKCQEGLRLAVESPAPVLLTPDNTNVDFETPRLFQRYALPYLQMATEACHARGKAHVAHMCGKLKPLLPLIAQAGLDGIESLTPPPFADTPLWEARRALPGVCIIGGLSPHLLVGGWTRPEIEAYLLTLFSRMAPGNDFILAVSDDTPADADITRFLWVGDLVNRSGELPLPASPPR